MVSKHRVLASGITILALVAVAVTLLYVTVGTASAEPAAVIKNDGLCSMIGSDADGNIIFGGVGEVTTVVENDNKVMLKCKGTGIENDSGRGQSFRGFLCGIGAPDGNFYFTDDSRATVSASGVGTLTCTFEF
jgi:hypothetical protein